MTDPRVYITEARVDTKNGYQAATISLVAVGGGVQVVTVDGVPQDKVHPHSVVYHVRLISPDRMIPDQLMEAESYEEAVKMAKKYAGKLEERQAKLDELTSELEEDEDEE